MQVESVKGNYSLGDRLQKLRIKKQLTWKQIAARLRLSESMLYQALRGDARFSEKTLFRLLQAEIAAGLRPTTDLDNYLEEYNAKKSEPWGFFMANEKDRNEPDLSPEEKRGLGQRLQWRRKSKRMSRAALAEKCGCEAELIAKLESGEVSNPPTKLIAALAAALGVTDGWLVSGLGFMSNDEIDKFKEQRGDFPTLQMLSTEELRAAHKHFEQQVSTQTEGLKSIYLEFARRINTELIYRMRVWEHKAESPD